jgi:hypothetical protein
MLKGYPAELEDLNDNGFVLVAARLPQNQRCADAVSAAGLKGLGLPPGYPLSARGKQIPHAHCQRIGSAVHNRRLHGIWCRSAATSDGEGRELAWYPAGAMLRARPIWKHPLPLADWLYARQWQDIGLDAQDDPG